MFNMYSLVTTGGLSLKSGIVWDFSDFVREVLDHELTVEGPTVSDLSLPLQLSGIES